MVLGWLKNRLQFNRRLYQSSLIEVRPSTIAGRGVFATTGIRKGETIEYAPLIYLTIEDREELKSTLLYHYYFIISKEDNLVAFPFGSAAFYNHSPAANASYHFMKDKQALVIKAHRDIATETEITINYNGRPDDTSTVYFPNRNENE